MVYKPCQDTYKGVSNSVTCICMYVFQSLVVKLLVAKFASNSCRFIRLGSRTNCSWPRANSSWPRAKSARSWTDCPRMRTYCSWSGTGCPRVRTYRSWSRTDCPWVRTDPSFSEVILFIILDAKRDTNTNSAVCFWLSEQCWISKH